ncbi:MULTISPECIES: hypothetical protein [Pseudoalteromonas]|nr:MULTISPECIES: hypothetical protein [Pseudoalteromonas]
MMTTNITIKQVRAALKKWANFWVKREMGRGFKSQSISDRTGQPTGGFSASEAMSVPDEIELITSLISQLRPECIKAIRARYMMPGTMTETSKLLGFDSKRSAEFWLVKAERSLMLELSN